MDEPRTAAELHDAMLAVIGEHGFPYGGGPALTEFSERVFANLRAARAEVAEPRTTGDTARKRVGTALTTDWRAEVAEPGDGPATAFYWETLARNLDAEVRALRAATAGREPLDALREDALAKAWMNTMAPDHDEKCLVDDGYGGCPVGAEIADFVPKVAAAYRAALDTPEDANRG